MNKLKELLVSFGIKIGENIAESELEKLLQKLHDSNADIYKLLTEALTAAAPHLTKLAADSANKIDDAVVSILIEAVSNSVKANSETVVKTDDNGDSSLTDPQSGNTGKP